MKIFNRKISVKFYLTVFVNFAAAVTFAQTSYNGTINLDVNGFGPAQNVETTISYTENATVVFTDTIRNGAVQFSFQTTGVAGIHAPQEYFCVTNIPGYADFNIAVSAFVNPVRLDVLNVFGQKVLCLRSNSETLTSSQGFTQESNFYVNLSGQPNGIYFLVLHTASRKGLSAKVVKTGENICGPSDLYQPASPVESAKLASAAGSNFTVSYSQILSDNDLARIENTSFDVLINPETDNTFYHTATMVAYPEYETTTTGQITIGDENIIAQGFELKIKDGNENHVLNSDEEGKYSIAIAKNPSATKPYVNAEDKEIQISITGENTTSIDDFVLTLDEDQEVANFNLRPKFTLKGPGNQTVKVKGEDENTIETVSSSYGNWEVVFDTTKVNLNNIRIISEAEGYYSKDSLISSLYFGVHDNIDMTLDKKFLYSWQGSTNAEKIQITGVGIDTLINVVENYYASRVYDSKDENKEVSIKASAWGYQDLTTQTNTAGSHEISMQLNPNEFKLSGTISEDDVTMEFIVDDDTQTSQVSYNYSYSRQQVIDSIDIRVKAMKNWFDTIDTTLRVGPTDNEYNIVMKQNRWPFIFGGQGNAPIHIEDENGRELGIANPVNGVWSFEMDTTTNEFNIRMYTEETNYYNKDTTFVAYAGNNLGIDMSLYQKFLYKWMGVTTPGATVRINGTLIDTTFVTSTGNFESNVYDSKEANLSHNITSSLTGYITRDTTTTENGNHNLEMILVEESSPEKEIIVKTIIRMSNNNDIVEGAQVIYEHMTPNGIQRDTSYTQGIAPQIYALDTIRTTADLATIKFIRYVKEVEQTIYYHFISDTTNNITLIEGDNGYKTEYVDPYDQVEDIIFEMLNKDNSPAVGAKGRLEYAAGGVYAESVSDAAGKITFENVPAGLELKMFAGYEKATDSTKVAYANVQYSTPANGSITELDKKQTWLFYLDNKKMHVPGKETGTEEDSVYVTGLQIQGLGQGAANVRNTMGLNDQFYLVPGSFNQQALDSIYKWTDEIERDYYNNEREITFVESPFTFGSNQVFLDFDYITNNDSPQVLGWNVSDGANNTSQVSGFASNGDGVIKGGSITIAGNRSGFVKEIVKRTNDITNAANGEDTVSERVAVNYIVNARARRYNIIIAENKKVPTVNYIVENYE